MTSILEKIAENSHRVQFSRFRPKTVHEFFALRLAAKLGDAPAAQHYLKLTGQYSQSQLLGAFRRVVRSGDQLDLGRRFHVELNRSPRKGANLETRGRLGAILITQRSIALAVLVDDDLEYAQARQLPSAPDQAIRGAVGFVSRLIGKFSIELAATQGVRNQSEMEGSPVHEAVVRALNEQSVGIMEVSRAELYDALAYPPVGSREELCYIVSRIWPSLDAEPGGPWTHSAAALGLYVQTERLFNQH
jgi:hypothetical protein